MFKSYQRTLISKIHLSDKDAGTSRKQNSEKQKKITDERSAKSIASMIMGRDAYDSNNPISVTVDAETLVVQTQANCGKH